MTAPFATKQSVPNGSLAAGQQCMQAGARARETALDRRADVLNLFGMEQPADSPTPVTPDELRKALTVWIVTAPKRIWLDYWHHAETAGKWSAAVDARNRFDPRVALADHLAQRLEQAGWEVRQPVRGGAFTHERRAENVKE